MIPQVKKILDYWFLIEIEEDGIKKYCLGAPVGEGSGLQIFKTDPIAKCHMGIVTTIKGERYGIARANPGYKDMLKKMEVEHSELDPIPEQFWTKRS